MAVTHLLQYSYVMCRCAAIIGKERKFQWVKMACFVVGSSFDLISVIGTVAQVLH